MSHDPADVDLYGPTYERFAAAVKADVRAQAFGDDLGQTSWLTADELSLFISWLRLGSDDSLLDVACGSRKPRAVGFTGLMSTPTPCRQPGTWRCKRALPTGPRSTRTTPPTA